ncbi:MAG: ABC transporter permease [Ruminococcaceae bacterium]|nr:ABC transporter permease [Oscillospiraceae bacterium]
MKYFIYAIKTELSNKASFAVNTISTALVIYFILQYFGSYTGILSNKYDKSPYYVLSSNIQKEISDRELDRISELKGFEMAEISCGNIGGNPSGISLLGILGKPLDAMMFGGEIAIEKNTDPNSVYIPYSYITKLEKNVGDELVLKKHKETGIFLFVGEDENNADDKDEYELVSFKICGTFGGGLSGIETLAFPEAAVLKHFRPTGIEIRLSVFQLTEEEFNADLKEIEGIFGNVTNLVDFDKIISDQISSMRWQSAVAFAIGMICVMFMYSYILSRRVRRFSIYSICGASKREITVITVLCCLFNYIVSFLLALILGFAANKLIFEPNLGYNTMNISFENGSILFLLFLGVYLIVTVFYAVDFLKDTAVTVYRRSE